MSSNLSEYWSRVRRTAQGWLHPEDEECFARERHSFNLDFPPPAFVGNIKSARVIILIANGGYKPDVTPGEFTAPDAALKYIERLSQPENANWAEVAPYYRSVNYGGLIFSGEAAVVNACAYRSPKISEEPENRRLLNKLPSVQFNRSWLLETVMPEVESGKRFIVGKRHGLWGLPYSIKSSRGFIADPAPVSPHLSKSVMEHLLAQLARV